MALLEVQNLSLEFGGKTVLRDLGFTLDRGEVKVVMGPSGSGKSSLLRCLNLLQKPTGGKILLNGQDITAPANFRAERGFDDWLKSHGLIGISGVDTRRLTRLIRQQGAPNGVLAHHPDGVFDVPAFYRAAAIDREGDFHGAFREVRCCYGGVALVRVGFVTKTRDSGNDAQFTPAGPPL